MEGRINKIVETYIGDFKNNIKEWLNSNDFDKSDLLKYIYDYEKIGLERDDFLKRKRVKNNVPYHNRCAAKRANGEQCTRRKKSEGDFCGTHNKGIPHGKVVCNMDDVSVLKKKCVWVQDIQGINYFIDSENNVYDHEGVLNDHSNPDVIAKYECKDGIYSIPEYTNN